MYVKGFSPESSTRLRWVKKKSIHRGVPPPWKRGAKEERTSVWCRKQLEQTDSTEFTLWRKEEGGRNGGMFGPQSLSDPSWSFCGGWPHCPEVQTPGDLCLCGHVRGCWLAICMNATASMEKSPSVLHCEPVSSWPGTVPTPVSAQLMEARGKQTILRFFYTFSYVIGKWSFHKNTKHS